MIVDRRRARAGNCARGVVPALALLLLGTVAFAGIGMLMAGHVARRGEPRGVERAVPRAAVPRRHGVPARQAARRAGGDRQAAARRRASETVRAVLTAEAFPIGEFVVLVVWAVAAPLLAARLFRWEE